MASMWWLRWRPTTWIQLGSAYTGISLGVFEGCIQESHSLSLQDHGTIIVVEHGTPLIRKIFLKWTFGERLRKAIDILSINIYLDSSPIGHINYPDYKHWHYVLIHDNVKAIDFDNISTQLPRCNTTVNSTDPAYRQCEHNIECVDGECLQRHAMLNTARFHKVFSHYFLPLSLHSNVTVLATIVQRLQNILSDKPEDKITSEELRSILKKLLLELPNTLLDHVPYVPPDLCDMGKPRKTTICDNWEGVQGDTPWI